MPNKAPPPSLLLQSSHIVPHVFIVFFMEKDSPPPPPTTTDAPFYYGPRSAAPAFLNVHYEYFMQLLPPFCEGFICFYKVINCNRGLISPSLSPSLNALGSLLCFGFKYARARDNKADIRL